MMSLKIFLGASKELGKNIEIVFEKVTFNDKKNEKSQKKKVVRNFLTNLKIIIFFEFFSENVFKTLLRGKETTRKKYRIVFEKFTFFDKNLKKSLKKKSCSKYFEKFKIFQKISTNFFFQQFFDIICIFNVSQKLFDIFS